MDGVVQYVNMFTATISPTSTDEGNMRHMLELELEAGLEGGILSTLDQVPNNVFVINQFDKAWKKHGNQDSMVNFLLAKERETDGRVTFCIPNSSGEWIRDPETGARIPPLLPENEDLNKGKQLLEEEANCSRGYSTCHYSLFTSGNENFCNPPGNQCYHI